MNTTQKIIAGFVVVGLIAVGGYFFPHSSKVTQVLQAGAVGDVNGSPRIVQVSLDLSTTTPTSPTVLATSTMFNSDGRDRIVTSIELFVTNIGSSTSNGSGVSSWIVKIGTSTDIYTVGVATSLLYNSSFSTSTPILFVASTSPGVVGTSGSDFARIWKAGTYLNTFLNATSSGANGTFGPAETGFEVVHYRTAP